MQHGPLLWDAFNEGVVPRAQARVNDFKNLLILGKASSEGDASNEAAIPPELQAVVTQVENGLTTVRSGTPPPTNIAALAFYDDFDDAFRRMNGRESWNFWLNFVAAVALILLFLGFGLATLWGAVNQDLSFWEKCTGSGISIGGLIGFFVWKPLDKSHAALINSTRFVITQAKYRAQIAACKAGKDPTIPADIVAAVKCISRVTEAILDDLN